MKLYAKQKIKASPFQWCTEPYCIALIYLIADLKKQLIYTVYIYFGLQRNISTMLRRYAVFSKTNS